MSIGSRKVTRITESKVRLPNNGISFMLTTGEEPLSNLEEFYVKMTETENLTCRPEWNSYHSLRLVRSADYIDSGHNLELSQIVPGVIIDNGTGYDLSGLRGILNDVVVGWHVKGKGWGLH